MTPKPTSLVASTRAGEEMIQADSIASEKVCDHPSTEKAERLLIGLDTVARQIRSWLEWNTKHREQNDPPLTTTDDTAVMLLPVPFWPSHGAFNNWIKLFEESAAAIRDGQVIAHPANSLSSQPESDTLYYELMALYNASRERERELTAEVERLRVHAEPSLLGRETVREAVEFYADPFAWKKLHDPGDDVRVPDFYSETSFGDMAKEALASLSPLKE